jgi:hypothetical protein
MRVEVAGKPELHRIARVGDAATRKVLVELQVFGEAVAVAV